VQYMIQAREVKQNDSREKENGERK
jgi:hypothetical protein